MIEDIEIDSWFELERVLYDIPKTPHGRFRSDFVYRGVADKNWGLDTSLKRLGPHYDAVEGPLLRNFAKYARPGDIPSDTLWFRLAVAQHHGLPTRLLDWSVSPRVATHFATCEEQHFDKDGAIWCLNVVALKEGLPERLRRKLVVEKAFLFSVEMLSDIVTLDAFDQLGADHDFAVLFEPPSLDARIINQGAIMSVMPGVHHDLRDFVRDHPDPGICRRIILPKERKWEIRDKLDQDNVTERMLFPGLDGLGRWLKRYYGPGPSAH